MSNVVCLFHDDCFDGLGAAWAVYKRFEDATFHNVKYKDPPPDGLEGKTVYIVDFCYPLDVLIQISLVAEAVYVLDHHKGVAKVIEQYNETMRLMGFDRTKFNAVFDTTRSGALLTWQTLHPNLAVPRIILHISDRDLWQFRLEESKAIMAGLGSYPLDLTIWDRLFHWDPSYTQNDHDHPHNRLMLSLESDGHVVLRKMQVDIERLVGLSLRTAQLGDYEVPLINMPRTMISEALETLAKEHPFAAGYFDSADYREFSLRSCAKNGIDVIPIAKLYGGGGHANAAGFKVSRDHPLAMI